MVHAVKGKVSLAATGLLYLVFNFRYAPGNIAGSLLATCEQLLLTAPYVVGLTILLVYFLQKMAGEKIPLDRVLRIYFTLGIIIGFLYALNEYWARS